MRKIWIQQFNDLSKQKKFRLLFKKFHFSTKYKIQNPTNLYFPEEFIPFFVEEQGGFEDYYCLERKGSENFGKVIVLSQGSIVMEWATWNDFIVWIKENW